MRYYYIIFFIHIITNMNICESDMLYEDYKKDTYSDQGNKLKWKATTANDYILTTSNNCMEYKYYGNQLSVVHPGVLANIYLKPSKYILEIEARILPVNSIYNDAFLYRRLTTKEGINYNINNFKQKRNIKSLQILSPKLKWSLTYLIAITAVHQISPMKGGQYYSAV